MPGESWNKSELLKILDFFQAKFYDKDLKWPFGPNVV